MNFSFVINNSYVNKMLVTAISISINNPGEHAFYIFSSDLTTSSITFIEKVLSQYNCYTIVVELDDRCLEGVPILRKDFNKTPYYKLLIPINIPPGVDKLLYLDSDIIVKGSLMNLYNIELKENYFAAVPDVIRNKKDKLYLQKLGIDYKSGERYFNSGLILFNMKVFRNAYSIESALKYICENGSEFKYHDQEVLNGLYFRNYIQIDNMYNYFTGFHNMAEIIYYLFGFENKRINEAVVLHFANLKPWNNDYIGKCKKIYWKYVKMNDEIYELLRLNEKNSIKSQLQTLLKRIVKKLIK